MELISKERAQAFAEARLLHHGNATAAARSLEYDNPSSKGHWYSRHPLVLRALAPLAQAHLNALTPKAIQTLASLLSTGSPYVRLEAAKDILDRNGVGTAHEPPRSQQLVVNINLSPITHGDVTPPVVLDVDAIADDVSEEGALENSDASHSSTSSAHDFSTEVLDNKVAQPLMIERSSIPSPLKQEGEQVFFAEESNFDLD
jgi:hypothetical protein